MEREVKDIITDINITTADVEITIILVITEKEVKDIITDINITDITKVIVQNIIMVMAMNENVIRIIF